MVDAVAVATASVTILGHEERKKRGLGGPERVAEHPLLPARARRAAEEADELPAAGQRLVRVRQREPELQLHPIDHFPLISSALRALICVVTAKLTLTHPLRSIDRSS